MNSIEHQDLAEEEQYLTKTLQTIERELEAEAGRLERNKQELVKTRREMWENTAHHSGDFERLTEISQYLAEVAAQTSGYATTVELARRYGTMLDAPYFGRFDFCEDGYDDREKIYIGKGTLIDSNTNQVLVYDWRAPIASLFYRFEPGPATYPTPVGDSSGKILLKRQYKISAGQLRYFFDCSLRISDEMLQEVLSRNASPKMRTIVETIQKEQDLIIRDSENELLMVQGAAGSGKTSIALHRIAYLLYEGLGTKLEANNIMILSPNPIFGSYIATVLPELGEANVQEATVEELFRTYYGDTYTVETRGKQLELLIQAEEQEAAITFKGSTVFTTILERLLKEFEYKLLRFEDVYFDGKYLATRQQLKNNFLSDKIGMPMAKRLKIMERRILERIQPLQRQRLPRLESIVQRSEGRDLEIKSFGRLLSMKQGHKFIRWLRSFSEIDCFALYTRLFTDRKLFWKLAQGLQLPEEIESILADTANRLSEGNLCYEDLLPLLYLRLVVEGNNNYGEIRQVVIDEAQDYHPLHYEVFKRLFTKANFTVLGDYNQSIDRAGEASVYDEVARIFAKPKTVKLVLNKSYRSSYEITQFCRGILGLSQDSSVFERHGEEPRVVSCADSDEMKAAIIKDAVAYLEEGFGSVAIICKTQAEAEALHQEAGIDAALVTDTAGEIEKGITILPGYMAKGLEFDVVLVYDGSEENYSGSLGRRLLYVACTRALHRLGVYKKCMVR